MRRCFLHFIIKIFNILNFSYFKCLTVDTIWNCFFGLDTDVQLSKNNSYTKNFDRFFQDFADYDIFMYLGGLNLILYEYDASSIIH